MTKPAIRLFKLFSSKSSSIRKLGTYFFSVLDSTKYLFLSSVISFLAIFSKLRSYPVYFNKSSSQKIYFLIHSSLIRISKSASNKLKIFSFVSASTVKILINFNEDVRQSNLCLSSKKYGPKAFNISTLK